MIIRLPMWSLVGRGNQSSPCRRASGSDRRSRNVAFIITENGVRTPRVMGFPDYREAPPAKP